MKRTDTLTKEDFWNELQKKYPKAMKEYCDWIDQLKTDIFWKTIFQSHSYPDSKYEGRRQYREPKNHDLPAFFQLGIFMQFVSENCKYAQFEVTGDWRLQITNWFRSREAMIKYETKNKNEGRLQH